MANQEKVSSTSGPMMELNGTCPHAIQGSDLTAINPFETPRLLSLFSIITFHTIFTVCMKRCIESDPFGLYNDCNS